MIPLLFIAYLILEYYERKGSKNDKVFINLQKYGPIFGALLGLLPQCGFSVLATMLYVSNNITLGTLIAVYISTSDEAIPVFLSNPEMHSTLIILLCLKFTIALIVGWLCDHVLFPHQKILSFDDLEEYDGEEEDYEEVDASGSCSCCYKEYSIPKSSFIRTFKIYGFVFLTSFVLTTLIHLIGQEALSKVLLTNSFFQPVVASIFGLIPNCAASVILCELYTLHQLSFGSLLAGLISNAGLGCLVLFEYHTPKKTIFRIIVLLITVASLCGLLFH